MIKQAMREYEATSDQAYVQLRTILDSVQIGAIRYFVSATTPEARREKVEQIQELLMPTVRLFWGNDSGAIDCPEGYTECHGACVPYTCPDRT